MKTLSRINHDVHQNVYEGFNGDRKVCCILDMNCVRYIVFVNGKRKSVREFDNSQTDVCFKSAEAALNR